MALTKVTYSMIDGAIVNVLDFGADPTGVSDSASAIRAAVTAGAGKDVYFPSGTYLLSTADAGAYITMAAQGTSLVFERFAKLLFTDAAVYGIRITAQLCAVNGGILWGTNTTSPTLSAVVRVEAPYAVIEGNNIAYAANGTHIATAYVIKHLNNTYAGCDRYFYTTGSCADIQSRNNTYGTSTIGSNPVVELVGSGGADIHDYWETQQTAKLSLACRTGSQRVQVRGKMFDSGGIVVGSSVYLRADIENQQSYTSTAFCTVDGGGVCDLTGSFVNGPGITSGVTAVVGNGTVHVGSGRITDWQVGIDANSGVHVSPSVLIANCTTGVDIATASSGIVNPTFLANTTNIVRTTSSTTSLPDGWEGSATYDPPSLSDGDGVSTTISVTGVRLGDTAAVSFSNDLQGVLLTAWCTTDTVNVRFQNETGGVVDLASGTLRATVSGKTI